MAKVSRRTYHFNRYILTSILAISPLDCRTYSMIGTVLPISLKYATLNAFHPLLLLMEHGNDVDVMMRLWMTAASGLPDTPDVYQSVVGVLLQMAYKDELRPHIPVVAWEWLKRRRILRLIISVPGRGIPKGFFQTVQALRDIGLIASYLFVIWSEWNFLTYGDCEEMRHLIREELNGIHAVGYRADLIQRLEFVLSQFDRGREYSCAPNLRVDEQSFWWARQQYEGFRRDLLELEEEVTMIMSGTLPRVITHFRLLTHMHV